MKGIFKDFLFGLKQEFKMYKNLQFQIKECDIEIEKLLQEQINNDHNKKQHYTDPKIHKRINKNICL